jgi:hypothetical protein
MVGIDARTGKAIERGPHIVQTIEKLLKTPTGTRVMRRGVGFDALQEDGRLKAGMQREDVEASVRQTLAAGEPRIDVDRVEVRLNGETLESITVGYRDREGGAPGEVIVRYGAAV